MPGGQTRATTREPSGRGGRPSSLSEETKRVFTSALLSLHTVEDAATLAGIDVSTVHRWIASGRKAERGMYREFYDAVENAKAKAKGSLVSKVVVEARKDPKLALKVLERRYPKEWGVTRKLELEDKTPANKRAGIRDRLEGMLDQIEKRLTAPPPAPVDTGETGDDDEEEDGGP